MSRTNRTLIFAIVSAVAIGIVTTLFVSRSSSQFTTTAAASPFTTVESRYRGNRQTPKYFAWFIRFIRYFARFEEHYSNVRTVLAGNDLTWTFSNPTSGWFQFGGISNRYCWEFAIPHTTNSEQAFRRFEQLDFHDGYSLAWSQVVGSNNVEVGAKYVGGGGIRLASGELLFVRPVTNQEQCYLVQVRTVEGARGDFKILLRYAPVPRMNERKPRSAKGDSPNRDWRIESEPLR